MADLLECLIQIKALGETLERMTQLPGGADAAVCGARLAEAERRYGIALGTDIEGRMPAAPGAAGPAAPQEEFAARRRLNLAMLNACTAARLGGPVDWPGRPSTTVADLVAIMLANDTEVLGELRRRRPSPGSRIPNPGESRLPPT
jgi:hypothetical protein